MRLCYDCVLAVSGSVTAAAPARREAVLRLPWQPAENRLRLEFLWLPESSPSSPLVRALPTLGSTDCVNSKTTGVTNRVSNINVSWRNEEVKWKHLVYVWDHSEGDNMVVFRRADVWKMKQFCFLNLPAMREAAVWFLGQEDPLEKREAAAAAAKSSVVSDSARPHRRQPARLPRPWDSSGKNTGVGCPFPSPVRESEKWEWSHSILELPWWLRLQRISLQCGRPGFDLCWEDPVEEGMATHSSMLAWRIPMDRETWRAVVHGITELDVTERLSTKGRTRATSGKYVWRQEGLDQYKNNFLLLLKLASDFNKDCK